MKGCFKAKTICGKLGTKRVLWNAVTIHCHDNEISCKGYTVLLLVSSFLI